jgi:exodeoxyribonuclease V gamma subunit
MLMVHRSERSDRLADALGDVLAGAPLGDELASEVVAVPTRGVERWITQRLSGRLGWGPGGGEGVCANFRFPFPGSLVIEATARACGIVAQEDPWVPARMVWPLLEVVDECIGEPFLSPLAAHVEQVSPAGVPQRFPVVRRVADLFDHYGVHRPQMLRRWLAGDTSGNPPEASPDDGAPGPDSLTVGSQRWPSGPGSWQPELWRRLRARIGVESPAERLARAAATLRADPAVLDWPERLSVFGLTRLPAGYLAILEAVAARRDVHIFLLHPSAALWDAVAAVGRPPAGLARVDDRSGDVAHHPLLRSWGRDAREMQLVLAAHGAPAGDHHPVGEAVPVPTLLGRIQSDIRANRRPPGRGSPDRLLLSPDDRSIAVHSCHGRARQVEVIRDAVLHLLADDPTLELRDVIVMCPDIETYAPLIQATFGIAPSGGGEVVGGAGSGAGGEAVGSGQAPPAPTLRVRLADRSLRHTNPLLGIAAQLLQLAGSRVTASEVLDLAARLPVRRRFRLDDDDLAQLERWVAGTNTRWGLDANHRRRWGLGEVGVNTWEFGLDRLLLGVALADEGDRMFAGVTPAGEVGGSQVDLVGRVAELVARLSDAVYRLSGRLPVGTWAQALATATESLATAAPGESWQGDELHRVLEEVAAEACETPIGEAADAGGRPDSGRGRQEGVGSGSAGQGPELSLAEIRSLLQRRLQGRPTRANFRTGDLTFCTLVPMRSVPHRAVCLLGLDDGIFPRHPVPDGDDLLAARPHVGDRDARSEDQQLLLDAVMAATEHLVITYAGRDQRTNQKRPPAVPVAELLDVIDRSARTQDGTPARQQVVVDHPLQPFDPRNFATGAVVAGIRWSHDRLQLGGARALSGARRPPEPFLPHPLPPLEVDTIALDRLVSFIEDPVKAFLRQRLGAQVGGWDDEISDALPVELDGLAKWSVGDRLLSACLAGVDMDRALAAERARGYLPPGRLADATLGEIRDQVGALQQAVQDLPCASVAAASMEVALDLGDGRQLVGTIPGVRGDTILRCVYSRLGPKHRLRAWVQFLALSASRPDLAVRACTAGRVESTKAMTNVCKAILSPLADTPEGRRSEALSRLAVVVDLYLRGMREPLPLFCKTSAAWAEARRVEHDAIASAAKEWQSSGWQKAEDQIPHHVLVYGGQAPFNDLLEEAPLASEQGPGWQVDETTRIGRLARRLWDPLLRHETMGHV